jgi:hypothetical protein
MRHVQTRPLQNEFGMQNGFNRRIHVLDGFVRPVLEISGAEVDGGRAWIPSSVEFLFPVKSICVCSWFAF